MTVEKRVTGPHDQVWRNPIHFLAFGFGSGLISIAPGTFGTVAAIPLYLLLRDLPVLYYLAVVVVLTVVGIYWCHITARDIGIHDYKGIVWDEVVGYLVTMIAAPQGWQWVVLGFVLFRVFDIWKPWPIKMLDREVKGGFGIVLDDLVAGVYSLVILQAILWITLWEKF